MMRIVRSGRKVLVSTRRQRQLERFRQDLLKSRNLLVRTLQWTPNLSDETLPGRSGRRGRPRTGSTV